MKVRIKKLPQARTGYQVQGSLANDVPAMGGADYNTYIGKPNLKSSKYITRVPREEANLEAEGGETVYGDINGDGMAEHKIIKGPRHSNGGVPLNLPDDTFIYSDFRGMNIKEPEFLEMFGKGGKGKKSYTPAALAKQYDIEKYRKILQDPNSDKIDRKTAELMIKNYQTKLAALALVQEGKKGFPQGMPAVAKPMTEENQYTEDTFVDPSVKQFAGQIEGKIKQAEENQATSEQDPDFAQQAQEAQEMNQGQPVAQPQEMEQPMAQYGMAMGGFEFPYETGLPEAQYGKSHSNKKPYKSQVNSVNNLGITNKQLNSQDAKSNRVFNSYNRIIDEYNDGTPSDTTYMYVTPTENVFFSSAIDPETKQKFGQRQSNNKLSQLTPEERSYYENKITQELGKKQYGGMSMEEYDLPEAEYGMAMGITSKNYMGRPKSPMYARGGALRTYQEAGATGGDPGSDEILDISGMDDDKANVVLYAWKKKHKDKEPKIMKDGKQWSYKPPTKKDKLTLDELKAVNATGQKWLETELKDPNSTVRKELIKKAREAYDDEKSYGSYGKKAFKDRRPSAQIKDEEFIDNILKGKRRNDQIKESNIDVTFLTNDGTSFESYAKLKARGAVTSLADYNAIKKEYHDKGWDSKENIAKTTGIKLPTEEETLLEQAGAHSLARMQLEKNKGSYDNYSDDDIYKIDALLGTNASRITNTGASDESEMGKLYGADFATLSPMDRWAGNSHLAQGINPALDKGTFVAPPEKKDETPCPPCQRADGTSYTPPKNADGTCGECETQNITPAEETEPKMWLQDRIKTAGAFGDLMSAKKYMPWTARYDLRTPKPTFLDPTRELAANAEQANIQTQALGQFAGPQALSARSSGIMGAASKNAADVLAKYNNANVNIANQFESNIANIENQEQQLNTAAQQKLYDQNTISNQQYDNTKRALRNNLMNQTVSGITNMMKTDALNQLYPQMKVDVSSGGKVYYDPSKSRQLKAEMSEDDAYFKNEKKCRDLGFTGADLQNCLKNSSAGGTGASGNPDADILAQHFAKGGFIYSDITYPFIL